MQASFYLVLSSISPCLLLTLPAWPDDLNRQEQTPRLSPPPSIVAEEIADEDLNPLRDPLLNDCAYCSDERREWYRDTAMLKRMAHVCGFDYVQIRYDRRYACPEGTVSASFYFSARGDQIAFDSAALAVKDPGAQRTARILHGDGTALPALFPREDADFGSLRRDRPDPRAEVNAGCGHPGDSPGADGLRPVLAQAGTFVSEVMVDRGRFSGLRFRCGDSAYVIDDSLDLRVMPIGPDPLAGKRAVVSAAFRLARFPQVAISREVHAPAADSAVRETPPLDSALVRRAQRQRWLHKGPVTTALGAISRLPLGGLIGLPVRVLTNAVIDAGTRRQTQREAFAAVVDILPCGELAHNNVSYSFALPGAEVVPRNDGRCDIAAIRFSLGRGDTRSVKGKVLLPFLGSIAPDIRITMHETGVWEPARMLMSCDAVAGDSRGMILQGCPALVRSGRSPIRFTSAYVTEAWIPGDTLRYRYVVDAVGGGSDSLVLASAAEAVAQKRSDASSRRWAISVRDFSVVTPDAWFLQRREHVLTGTRGTDEVSMVRIFLYSSGERRWIAQTAVAQL